MSRSSDIVTYNRGPKRSQPRALSQEESEELTRLFKRLRVRLRKVLQALRASKRNPSSLSRKINLSRPTCQRVYVLVEEGEDLYVAVSRGAGVSGLERFSKCALEYGVSEDRIDSLNQIIIQLDQLTRQLARSQKGLLQRLETGLEDGQKKLRNIPASSKDKDESLQPLSESEDGYARNVGRRLRAVLYQVFSSLPDHAQYAAGMARYLDISRSTCQKILNCSTPDQDELSVLTHGPAIAGLKKFVEAAIKAKVGGQWIGALEAAIEQYDRLLKSLGCSQRVLLQRLEKLRQLNLAGDGHDFYLETCRNLYSNASKLVGHSSEMTITTYVVKPEDGPDSTHCDSICLRGLIGSKMTENAIPLLHGYIASQEIDMDYEDKSIFRKKNAVRPGFWLLEDFCSKPLPHITQKDHDGDVWLVSEYDESVASFDNITALRHRFADPRNPETKTELYLGALVRYPTRYLQVDVILHKSLAEVSIPSCGAYVCNPAVIGSPGSRWYHEDPHKPSLELLGSGENAVAACAYPRYEELLSNVMEGLGLDPEEFVGYRIKHQYPSWGSRVLCFFDFLAYHSDEERSNAQKLEISN